MTRRDLLDRVLSHKLPSAVWGMLRSWFLTRSLSREVEMEAPFQRIIDGEEEGSDESDTRGREPLYHDCPQSVISGRLSSYHPSSIHDSQFNTPWTKEVYCVEYIDHCAHYNRPNISYCTQYIY